MLVVLTIATSYVFCFFFFNDTATTEIYTLSLHDALPILETNNVSPDTYPTRYIDSYMGYLNKSTPILNVNRYLLHTPCGVAKATEKAMGGILCLWNDVRVDDKTLLLHHNGMPEDLLPFAERYWRGGKAPATSSKDLIPDPATEGWETLRGVETKMI